MDHTVVWLLFQCIFGSSIALELKASLKIAAATMLLAILNQERTSIVASAQTYTEPIYHAMVLSVYISPFTFVHQEVQNAKCKTSNDFVMHAILRRLEQCPRWFTQHRRYHQHSDDFSQLSDSSWLECPFLYRKINFPGIHEELSPFHLVILRRLTHQISHR